MRTFIAALLVLLGITLAKVYDLATTETNSDLFTPENVERVRQNLPEGYEGLEFRHQGNRIEPRYIPPKPDEASVRCLQRNLYFEARNQGVDGQVAVAWVTINRVNSRHYPNTICDVVHQGVHRNGVPVRHQCKFSWYCDGKSDTAYDTRAWEIAGEIAYHMVENCLVQSTEVCPVDQTGGALYYHTEYVPGSNPPEKLEPSWSKVYTASTQINSHIFYTRN